MKLPALLEKKRKDILRRWFSLIVESYPPDVSSFLASEKDRFANPVGHTILAGIEVLFDEVTHGGNSDKIVAALDSIIRIRAVQDFTPSQAVAFVFFLKKAVREELIAEKQHDMFGEFLQFETKVDDFASLAFDVYVACRDAINRIKSRESGTDKAIESHLARIMKSRGEKD